MSIVRIEGLGGDRVSGDCPQFEAVIKNAFSVMAYSLYLGSTASNPCPDLEAGQLFFLGFCSRKTIEIVCEYWDEYAFFYYYHSPEDLEESTAEICTKIAKFTGWEHPQFIDSPSEDVGADSFDTQEDDFDVEVTALAVRLLESKSAALKTRIESLVKRHISWLMPGNKTVHIAIDGSVEVNVSERDDA